MARVPISFYLNILAGILVLFNHYVTSETGDVALNKVTGATARFYTLFRDTALTFQRSWHLEMALCGSVVDNFLPHEAASYLRDHYCHPLPQESEGVGGTSRDRKSPGGYGGSDSAFMYYQTPVWPLARRTNVEGPKRLYFSLRWPSQGHLSSAIWSNKAIATLGVLLLRTGASWWWFRVPLKMMSLLLTSYSVLLALGYLFGASMVIQCVSRVYMAVIVDFLQCMEWEAQRQVLDIGVMTMERAYGFVTCKGIPGSGMFGYQEL